jgi:hypothetical protein
MARIRSVLPGLLTDEAFMALTVECPLAVALLLGLWMEADDAGVFQWKPLTIKARILPAVLSPIDETLAVLTRLNFIRRFELDGKSLGVVRNFVKFQRPKKPSDVLPASAEMRSYAGFTADGKRPHAGTGRPPDDDSSEPVPNAPKGVPNSPETASEKPPQRKEEGGRMKDEVESSSLRSLTRDASDAELAATYRRLEAAAAPKPGKRKAADGPEAIKAELAKVLDVEHVEAVYSYRLALKAAQTSYATRLLADELAKTGSPNEAADLMILKNWRGFKAAWWESDRADRAHDARAGPTRPHAPIRTNTLFRAALDSQADENRHRYDDIDGGEHLALAHVEDQSP